MRLDAPLGLALPCLEGRGRSAIRSPEIAFLVWAAIICLGLLIAPAGVEAQDTAVSKPAVQVEFHIAAKRYTDHFTTEEIGAIERDVAQALVTALGSQIGFLTFTPDPQPVHLGVTLTYRESTDPQAGPRKDTILRVELRIPGRSSATHDKWVFRTWKEFLETLSTPEATSASLTLAFDKEASPPPPWDDLVESVLSQIPLSPTALLLWKRGPDPQSNVEHVAAVIVPILASQLCMDRDTLLRLRSDLPGEFAPQTIEVPVVSRGEFRPLDPTLLPEDVGLLFGEPQRTAPDGPQWDVIDRSPKNAVRVSGVFVRTYKPLDTGCSVVVKPADSGLTGGDGR